MASNYGQGSGNNYNGYYNYNKNNNNGESESQSSDEEGGAQMYQALAHTGSFSVIFAGLYTLLLAVGLSIFGATSVVGFVSPTGRYVEPVVNMNVNGGCVCGDISLSSDSHDRNQGVGTRAMNASLRSSSLSGGKNHPKFVGMFLGALVFFSNMLLVCAVVLGEFHVSGMDERQREEVGMEYEYFAIEKTASVLGTMSMFLAVLYFLYSMLLFAMKDVLIQQTDNELDRHVGYVAPSEAIA